VNQPPHGQNEGCPQLLETLRCVLQPKENSQLFMKNRHFLFQLYPSFAYYSVNFVLITTGKNKEDITFFYLKSVKRQIV